MNMSRIVKAKNVVVTVPVAENEVGDDSTGLPGQLVEAREIPGVSPPNPDYEPLVDAVRIAQTNTLTAGELYGAEKGQLGWP
jgi:hypothetical protein